MARAKLDLIMPRLVMARLGIKNNAAVGKYVNFYRIIRDYSAENVRMDEQNIP